MVRGVSSLATAGPDVVSIGFPGPIPVDTPATAEWARRIAGWQRGRAIRRSLDPVHEYFINILSCPTLTLGLGPRGMTRASLDSLCNFR